MFAPRFVGNRVAQAGCHVHVYGAQDSINLRSCPHNMMLHQNTGSLWSTLLFSCICTNICEDLHQDSILSLRIEFMSCHVSIKTLGLPGPLLHVSAVPGYLWTLHLQCDHAKAVLPPGICGPGDAGQPDGAAAAGAGAWHCSDRGRPAVRGPQSPVRLCGRPLPGLPAAARHPPGHLTSVILSLPLIR